MTPADSIVQVPVDSVLDARPVSTYANGQVVPWTPDQGIDSADGLVTDAVEAHLGQTGTALPDDGHFAPDSDHPEVDLHFSNDAPASSFQARLVMGAGSFQFPVPPASYTKLFLLMSSSYGDSPLAVTMTYGDGTTSTTSFSLPDWGTGQPLPANPPIFFDLASGMHKWTEQDEQVDAPVHTLTGVALAPDATRQLESVQVDKSGAAQDLIFWGATGLVSGTFDAAGDASVEGAADTGLDASISLDASLSLSNGDSAGARSDGDVGSDDSAPASNASGTEASGMQAPAASGASAPSGMSAPPSPASGAPSATGGRGGCSSAPAPSRSATFLAACIALIGAGARRGFHSSREGEGLSQPPLNSS